MNLDGCGVLITGGRRVGSELAVLLADRGARIAMTYRTSKAPIEQTLEACRNRGAEGLAIEADLAEPDQAEHAVRSVGDRFGRLDVLVNMASIYERQAFTDLRPEHYERMIATNLTAPYYTAVAAGKAMLSQSPIDEPTGLKGKIIQVGDWSVNRPTSGCLPYITAKGGLTTMTLALAKELAPSVTVNIIQPATILPPPDMPPEEQEAARQAAPLKRLGAAGDANSLILWLLEGTDFATGGQYFIDGGRFLGTDDQPT